MKLTRVCIRNLRCIDSLEFFPRTYTSLIGPNNAGKSTVLRAIELLLNQEKPLADEWRRSHETDPIEIEADFEHIEEWERNKPGVSSLIHGGKILLRYRATCADDGSGSRKVDITYEAKVPEESIDGWSDQWANVSQEIKDLAATIGVTTGNHWRTQANKERVRQLVREQMPAQVHQTGDPRWTSEGISINAALQQALPQAQVIPAVRDAGEDGKPGAKTSFGLLIKSIILPAVTGSEEYTRLMEAVRTLERRLKGDGAEQLPAVRELADRITERLSKLIAARVSLGMDPPDAEKFIGSSTVLRLDDGTDTRIGLQGHGLQRALVFALLEVLASQKARLEMEQGLPAQTRSTVLLFEEPELFIHPHLMRRLKETLRAISQRADWQVIISTHSPFLVDVADDPCSLVIHRRDQGAQPPRIKQLAADPLSGAAMQEERQRLRATLDFHPTVCEAFFAKHVVLVEGDTEIASLVRQPELYRLAGVTEDNHRDVTVVSCDGKWTIIPIARLLNAFGIPLRVIHDRDRKGKADEELAQDRSHEFHANIRIAEVAGNESVLVIDDTFEHVLWDPETAPQSAKDKPFRAWRRVRELCDARENLNHAPRLKQVVEFAFRPFPSPPAPAADVPAPAPNTTA